MKPKLENVATAILKRPTPWHGCVSPYPLYLRHSCQVGSRWTYKLPSCSVCTTQWPCL